MVRLSKLTANSMIVYLQFTSIGEMTTYKPVHGGFIRQCIEYVEPAFGFAVGINFWFSVGLPHARSV